MGERGDAMGSERKKSRWPLRAAFALLALPVLYVLSVGPAWYCFCRGWLPDQALDLYTPLDRFMWAVSLHVYYDHYLAW